VLFEWRLSFGFLYTSRDFNAARKDIIVRLMDRVEQLEARIDAQLPVSTISSFGISLPCPKDYEEDL
jgi:hypothetical protein